MLAKLQPSDLPPKVSIFQLRAAPHKDMWHLLLTRKMTTLQGCMLKAESAYMQVVEKSWLSLLAEPLQGCMAIVKMGIALNPLWK